MRRLRQTSQRMTARASRTAKPPQAIITTTFTSIIIWCESDSRMDGAVVDMTVVTISVTFIVVASVMLSHVVLASLEVPNFVAFVVFTIFAILFSLLFV